MKKVISASVENDTLPDFDIFKDEVIGMWSGRPEDVADDATDVANHIWPQQGGVYGELEQDNLVLYVTTYDDETYEFRCIINKVGRGTYEISKVTQPVKY